MSCAQAIFSCSNQDMCYMIAVGLSKSSQQEWLDKLPRPMRAWPSQYKGLSSHMGDFEVFIVGTSMCSCDLFNRGSNENLYEKYRKKGWSRTKIERAIANRKKEELYVGLHPKFRSWLADAADDTKEAYLLIHWDSDVLNYKYQVSISPEEMREQTFPVEEEKVIRIRRN